MPLSFSWILILLSYFGLLCGTEFGNGNKPDDKDLDKPLPTQTEEDPDPAGEATDSPVDSKPILKDLSSQLFNDCASPLADGMEGAYRSDLLSEDYDVVAGEEAVTLSFKSQIYLFTVAEEGSGFAVASETIKVFDTSSCELVSSTDSLVTYSYISDEVSYQISWKKVDGVVTQVVIQSGEDVVETVESIADER